MDIDRDGLSRIKELLKNNPRGMNVTEIAREIGMNRLSVAKYLEMLVISGHLDVKAFGPSKVYFLSQRLPISAMLSLSSDFIIILDKDLRIINVNDKFLEFTKFKRSEILFQKLDTLSFPLEFRPSLIPSVSAALNGQNHAAEAYFKKKEKESFFNIKFIPLVFDDGQKGVTLLFEDITERKRIELAIKESELKLRSIIDQSLDGITLTDERGRIIEYNKGEEDILGIARENAIGMNIWDLQASMIADMRDKPEFRDRIKSLVQKYLKTGKIPETNYYMELSIDHNDGSKRIIHVMTFSIKTEKGFMLCGITRDITERKRVEQLIKESEARHRAIFEGTFQFIGLLTVDGMLLDVNRPALELVNMEKSDVVGKPFWETPWCTYSEEISGKIRDSIIRAGRGEFVRFKTMIINAGDGSSHEIDYSIKPILDDAGKIVQLIPEGRDITDLKRAEEALSESEEKFRVLAETSTAAIFHVQGVRTVSVNKAAETITGYSKAELLNMNYWDIIHPDFRELVKERSLARQRNEPVPSQYEIRLLTKGGETRWAELTAGLIYYQGKPAAVATIYDITERKCAELMIKESETKFRAIFEQAAVGIAYVDENDHIKSTNKRFCDILGYEQDELIGLTYNDITYSEDITLTAEYLEQLKARKISSYSCEKRYFRKDGSIVWTNVTVSLLNTNDADNYHIVIIEDIMARKQAEEALRKAELHLAKAQRIAQVGSWEVVLKDPSLDLKNVDVLWSDEMYRILGIGTKARTTGFRQFLNLVRPEDRDILKGVQNDLITNKRNTSVDIRIITRNGIEKILHTESSVELDDNGNIARLYGTAQDITEHSLMEEALRKARDELEKTVDERTLELKATNERLQSEIARKIEIELSLRESEADLLTAQKIARLGFWHMDLKTNTCKWSDGNYLILDYNVGECIPCMDSWMARVHPDDLDMILKKIHDVANDDVSYSLDYRIVHRDGSIHYMHDETGSPIKDSAGNPVKLFGTMQDVTELRQAEAALMEKQEELEAQAEELRVNNDELENEIMYRRQAQEALESSEERFRSLIHNSSDIIRILDRNRLIIYDSPSSGKILGYPDGYMIGRSPYDFIHPEDMDRTRNDLSEVYNNKNTGTPTEFRIRKADGEYLDVESVAMNMIGVPGVDGIVITTRAITERKRAEDVIRASEHKFRSLVENISDGVWETDRSLAFTYMSPKSFDMIGYKPEEMLGKTPYDFMNSEEAKRVKGLLYSVALETKPFNLFECILLHKDGHIVNVEISGDPIFSSSGAFIGYRGITRDVTQRNKDKYDLSVANRSLRLLSDCNRTLIQSTDERTLLIDICHILVETGEYRLAWVGYKELDAEKRIIPVADAGNDTGYLDTIKLSWSEECVGGMGPGGMAIRNGNPFILRWDGLSGQFEWWRKEAIDRGITSIIGLPLIENGQAFGVLLVYSNRMDAFNDTEVELLKELSDNISYSITAIRDRSNL